MLKKYIRSMLESYRETHKSVPSLVGGVAIGAVETYTAPSDGWLFCSSEDDEVSIVDTQNAYQMFIPGVGPSWKSVVLRVIKGKTYKIHATSVRTFYPDVGS